MSDSANRSANPFYLFESANPYNLFASPNRNYLEYNIHNSNLSKEGLEILKYINPVTSMAYFEGMLDEAIKIKLEKEIKKIEEDDENFNEKEKLEEIKVLKKGFKEEKEKTLKIWQKSLEIWYKKMQALDKMEEKDTGLFKEINYDEVNSINSMLLISRISFALAIVIIAAASYAFCTNAAISLPLAYFANAAIPLPLAYLAGIACAFISDIFDNKYKNSSKYGKYQRSLNALKHNNSLTSNQKNQLQNNIKAFDKERRAIFNVAENLKLSMQNEMIFYQEHGFADNKMEAYTRLTANPNQENNKQEAYIPSTQPANTNQENKEQQLYLRPMQEKENFPIDNFKSLAPSNKEDREKAPMICSNNNKSCNNSGLMQNCKDNKMETMAV